VEWLEIELDRESFSDDLKRPTKSAGTVVTLGESAELEALIGGLSDPEILVTVSDVESPMSFVLEKHLEDFLVSNWANTELGKSYDILTDEGIVVGQQYQTDTGPIDILAVSKDGSELLVVELKRGRVSDVVVGQILRYMGYVNELDPNKRVRGVIVGTDDDQKFRRALSMVENIDFYRYEVDFKLFRS
jgi:restriction system protein